ncbi:unnamed protein product [Moneuplotes crassus]|uniref:Uncharacterized protein n=1 Tax=Euplotes crassus TaxID=5936 RepID=A0AAD1Y104_EUPCR|nr:unnamed protein product [Moneuplotes crassus]
MSVFAFYRQLGFIFVIACVVAAIVSSSTLFGDVRDRYSKIETKIMMFQVVNLCLLCICIVHFFFHSIGAYQAESLGKCFKYFRMIPLIGFIFTAAWLTHITSSKEFYDTSINSKYNSYIGVMIYQVINYFVCWFPYTVNEYITVFKNVY